MLNVTEVHKVYAEVLLLLVLQKCMRLDMYSFCNIGAGGINRDAENATVVQCEV